MTGFKSIFLAVAAATLAVSSPVRQPHKTDNGTVHIRSGPIFYTGPWQNFPSADTWLTYDELVRGPLLVLYFFHSFFFCFFCIYHTSC